jgi:Cu/Ag efflux pump CusA
MDEGMCCSRLRIPTRALPSQKQIEFLRQVEKIINLCSGGIELFMAHGNTDGSSSLRSPTQVIILFNLKRKGTGPRRRHLRYQETVESSQPALRIDFGQVIGDMLGDLMTSVQPISYKIFGNDIKKLEGLSQQVAEQIQKVEGTADVFDGIVIAGPSVNIEPDYKPAVSIWN